MVLKKALEDCALGLVTFIVDSNKTRDVFFFLFLCRAYEERDLIENL